MFAAAILGLHLTACAQGKTAAAAMCGSYGVYENRAAQSGRVIALNTVVLKAPHPNRRAIAILAGGPGQSAVSFAPLVADGIFMKAIGTLRDRYDVVFVDSRGMGDSNPFGCRLTPAEKPQLYFRQLWPDRLVAVCRAKVAADHHVNLYNVNSAVDDLDSLRAALGYPKLVLEGGSFGTFTAMVYIRRHAEHVESAVLGGAFAPHFLPLPGEPRGAQTALDDLVTKCEHDLVCHMHFPKFSEHFRAVVARFDRGPVRVKVKNATTKRYQSVLLSKEVLVDDLRQALDDPGNAAYLPFITERAYYGDYVPLGEMIDAIAQGLAHALDWGAFFSYSCADEIPFLSEPALREQARHSFAGDLRARAQQRACKIWNVRPNSPAFNGLVRSTVPMLFISGSDDPATPARYGEAALRYLPNAREVLVQGAGHAEELPCTDELIVQFVRARSARHLDLKKCKAAFKPPHFTISDG